MDVLYPQHLQHALRTRVLGVLLGQCQGQCWGDAEPTWHTSTMSVGCCVGKGGPCSPLLPTEHRCYHSGLWPEV